MVSSSRSLRLGIVLPFADYRPIRQFSAAFPIAMKGKIFRIADGKGGAVRLGPVVVRSIRRWLGSVVLREGSS